MAEVVIPAQVSPGINSSHTDEHCDIEGAGSPYSLNQAFSFPSQSVYNTPSSLQQQNASISQAVVHRHKPSNLSLAKLPPFEFGMRSPANSLRLSPSPTRSPVGLTPPSHPQMGHKRAGSEFIGGDITGTGPVLVPTTSPDDLRPPSAPSSPVRGPPGSRRGHAHRRSHAVSQSDIKFMMQPEARNQAGSLPVTPFEEPNAYTFPGPQKANSQDGMRSHTYSRSNLSSSLPASVPRNRVEFSDTPEYIPRPLSTISSETSSSMSTVRANHSISGSVSSLHNGGVSSPSLLRSSGISSTSRGSGDQDELKNTQISFTSKISKDVLQMHSENNVGLAGDQLQMSPLSTLSDKNDHQDLANQVDPFDFRSGSRPPIQSNTFLPDQETSRSAKKHSDPVADSARSRPKTSPESSKSPSVKKWAGNLPHGQEGSDNGYGTPLQEPTLYTSGTRQESRFSIEDITFDDDTTMIIEEPAVPVASTSNPLPTTRKLDNSLEISTPNPMIDLDLAMDSGLPGDGTIDSWGRAAGKRRLHSSGETGGFTGPGMHYHRRTESAPEMEHCDRPRLGFPRLGSNPAMEEAIVEEDEEANDNQDSHAHALGLGVNIVDEDFPSPKPQRQHLNKTGTDSRRVLRRIRTPPDTLPVLPVKIVDAEEEPRFSVVTKSSDESSITPTVTPDPFATRPASAPLDFAIQTPSLTYGTTPETRSAVSSADYRQTSFDFREPRLHTARSSMTDRVTLNSSKAGDTSAGSLDDVPSLTSSSSTVMSGFPPRISGFHQTSDSTARSASFSGPATTRGRPGSSSKRASLASLSKLMGGTYNRSKLNIAETMRPDTPSPEKSQKKKHRMSRMMKFWKSKESLQST